MKSSSTGTSYPNNWTYSTALPVSVAGCCSSSVSGCSGTEGVSVGSFSGGGGVRRTISSFIQSEKITLFLKSVGTKSGGGW